LTVSERIHPITMPRWGMTMTEGKLVVWLAQDGQAIEPGNDLMEIETSKITNVVEAPAAGVIRRQLIREGVTVPVGTLLGVIAGTDVPDNEIDSFVASQRVAAAAAEQSVEGPSARVVDAGDFTVNVLSTGSGDATPVILIHGFGGDLNSWMFNQPELSVDRPAHAVDLPGHGDSGLVMESGSVPELARSVIAAMDALAIERAHFIGHSLGGAVALFLAIKHPRRVASALLVAPGGLGPEINMAFIDGLITADRRKAMQSVLESLFADPKLASRRMADDLLQAKRRDGVPEALRRIAAANFADGRQAGGMRAGLASLKIPIAVVWGAGDKVIPAAQAEGLPGNVVVHVIESAGHMPHMESAQAFNGIARQFIEDADRIDEKSR
jgi:pyruvate dehydrogenase E2 component (dihydrolipoamide acetyltransferase)